MARALIVSVILAASGLIPTGATAGPLRGEVPLRVNEGAHRFDVPTRNLTVRPGITTFTVLVPRKAKRPHGVAITGGEYNGVKGVAVGRGRSTSLTMRLRPGNYVVHDSVGRNRQRGYYVHVRVLSRSGGQIRTRGTKCEGFLYSFSFFSTAFVRGTDCETAETIAERVYNSWREHNFSWKPRTVYKHRCQFDPWNKLGFSVICRRGSSSVTFRNTPDLFP